MDIRATARRVRREILRDVLRGTSQQRLNYAIARAMEKNNVELSAIGSTVYDSAAITGMARHWFERLERIATANKEQA